MHKIYLDNSATTKVDPVVLKKMLPYFEKEYGNASSIHFMGRHAYEALENAKGICAKVLDCDPAGLVFTSGATESNNMILKGVANAALGDQNAKMPHLLVSQIEHSSVLNPTTELAKKGFEIEEIPVNEKGIIDVEKFKKMIRRETILVSIMAVNNEIGTIQNIKALAKIAHNNDILFHTDAVQAVPFLEIDIKDWDVDFLSLSAHKFHGPKGAGIAYIGKKSAVRPLLLGGGQEEGMRGGTYNIPGIVGMATALELAYQNREKTVSEMKNLRDYMWKRIEKEIPRVILNGDLTKRTENNLNIRFEQVEGEAILMELSEKGICVSTGSACSSKKLETSHVLTALKIPEEFMNSNIRFTLSKFTTKEDIDYTVDCLKKVVERLRNFSAIP